MGRINVLDFDVANLIAAGEVVDRPASVVKELCENAIDAGATDITVEIRHGGTTLIRVSDNGCGIDREDMPLTVLRHATSKIATAEDLATIGTLGFRGEALAAIAAVCKLKMYSRPASEQMGCVMYCEGGEIIDIVEAGCAAGTTVIASELFYNVPARRKFLKKDASECAAVTAVMEKIAMSVPHISVQYVTDGELRFKTVGDGDLRGVIYSVFGKATASRMTAVDRTDQSGIRVSGYIGEPDLVRANKNSENFFINSRFVKSRTAMAALEQAYSTRIPSSKFPVCVLNIQLNPAAVDVNVHPSKREVKFANERIVFEAVYYAVLNALQTGASRPEMNIGIPFYSSGTRREEENSPKSGFAPKPFERRTAKNIYQGKSGEAPNRALGFEKSSAEPDNTAKSIAERTDAGDTYIKSKPEYTAAFNGAHDSGDVSAAAAHMTPKAQYEPVTAPRRDPLSAFVPVERDKGEKKAAQLTIDTAGAALPQPAPDADGEKPEETQITETQPPAKDYANGKIPDYTILGEAYNCYVILQLEDRLLIVDKHAAHERILFDELCRRMSEKERHSQILMFPLKISLDGEEMEALGEYGDKIRSVGFGFSLDEKSGVLSVSEIPQELGRDAAQDMMEELLSVLSAGSGTVETTQAKYFEAKLYQASCKAAIKGGRVYGTEHIRWICDRLLKEPGEDGAVIKTCPHGRPVAFEIKKSSIDRQFDRLK